MKQRDIPRFNDATAASPPRAQLASSSTLHPKKTLVFFLQPNVADSYHSFILWNNLWLSLFLTSRDTGWCSLEGKSHQSNAVRNAVFGPWMSGEPFNPDRCCSLGSMQRRRELHGHYEDIERGRSLMGLRSKRKDSIRMGHIYLRVALWIA